MTRLRSSPPPLRGSRLRFVAAFAVTLAVAAGALTSVVSCEDAQSYVYSAQKYDPAAMCLATYKPVEVVNGSGASSTCPPACLTVGADLYVSTMCPPLPAIATAVEADASDCIAALAAVKAHASCDTPAEAGGEEAGEDASPDGGTDARPDTSVPDTSMPVDAAEAG